MPGFFRRLIGLQRRVTCPYCLGRMQLGSEDRVCSAENGCRRDLPEWALCEGHLYPPLPILLLGPRASGKTFYTVAACRTLINRSWSGPRCSPRLAEEWVEPYIRHHWEDPEWTRLAPTPDGVTLLLHGLNRRWLPRGSRGRAVIFRNPGAEQPYTDEQERSGRLFFSRTRTFMLCTPLAEPDRRDPEHHPRREADLVTRLLDELRNAHAAPLGRTIFGSRPGTLVVNLTQSDHADPAALPPAAARLVGETRRRRDDEEADYVAELETISYALRECVMAWKPELGLALQVAARDGFRVHYCATSAGCIDEESPPPAPPASPFPADTGAFVRVRPDEPDWSPFAAPALRHQRREFRWQPNRILDPIFLALELDR